MVGSHKVHGRDSKLKIQMVGSSMSKTFNGLMASIEAVLINQIIIELQRIRVKVIITVLSNKGLQKCVHMQKAKRILWCLRRYKLALPVNSHQTTNKMILSRWVIYTKEPVYAFIDLKIYGKDVLNTHDHAYVKKPFDVST